LIFLAPKQATFQLERQLLTDDSLNGCTRLHIFSFERLASFIFEKLTAAPLNCLSEEGRVMILRALLLQFGNRLKIFRQSARRPGCAQPLSQLLNELQQNQFSPVKLRALGQRKNLRSELRDKLNDLALLYENYLRWLDEHNLQDANSWLDAATDVLRKTIPAQDSKIKIQNLYLDGFAEMTPQELDLLTAIIPFCEDATLAFCLDESVAHGTKNSWLSGWNIVGEIFQQCRQRIENLPGIKIEIEILQPGSTANRFANNADLDWLAKNWLQPAQGAEFKSQNSVQVVVCANPEAESVFAAREILKFIRSGNRFRDCAVLVRDLKDYHKPLTRVFRRYEIPFFLDRREAIAHHPLAELTRSALRIVAFDWRHEDWFAALKSGFSSLVETEIDQLENAALEFGWRGKKWRESLPDEKFERLRAKIAPPFENLFWQLAKLKFQPNGKQLADTLLELWEQLKVEQRLQSWVDGISAGSPIRRFTDSRNVHATVLEQMNLWLENLRLGFPNEALFVRDWLPILESGLANLTVGVIPPVLDEVLVGAIDRARNPDLKFALVLGVNEGVFPAKPAFPVILTETDRDELQMPLGPDLREQLSRERFYGYIACTRAREKLTVTFSRRDTAGKTLNPSPFIGHLQQIFPTLKIEEFQNKIDWPAVQKAVEIAPLISGIRNFEFRTQSETELFNSSALKSFRENLLQRREPDSRESLSSTIAEKLYGLVLHSSVSRLEEFAQCPFKFFMRSGLRAGERKIFELDARERGNFQHDVLKTFHEQLRAEGKHWRDLTPVEARERVGQIAAERMKTFRDGLLRDSAETLFAARMMAASLQDFVETIVAWMRSQYEFDPVAVELDFGGENSRASAWEINLSSTRKLVLHGRIDRVDLWREPNDNSALAVVMDYKSGGKKLDSLLVENGVQLQLLAYLDALRHWKNPREIFDVEKLTPVGAFYINLRGEFESGDSRDEILGGTEARKLAYRHNGRFDAHWIKKIDRRENVSKGDQFNFRLNKDGSLPANSSEALQSNEFAGLLDRVEMQLRSLGGKIFSGEAKVDPYRKGQETPCEFCDYRAACRIDEWTHEWRMLRREKTHATA
jgi:ATP-dependent helicase/nuclease subunit B